jgi:hypothetical protein
LETFVGDTVLLSVSTDIALSAYSAWIIKFRRPDGTTGYWTASIDPDDSNRMIYATSPTDLNMEGLWVLQAHVEGVDTALHGLWVGLRVHDPLPETTASPTSAGPTTAP